MLATKRDRKQLAGHFNHYGKELAKKRAECYTGHNFTALAKENDSIVGVLQWYIKEDPNAGVAELEELYVLEKYRNKGIASSLTCYAIQSIRDYFKDNGIRPRKIFAFVSKNNPASRRTNEKNGFKLISEVGDLFAENKTELFYVLDL